MNALWSPLHISLQVALSAALLVACAGTFFAWRLAGRRSLAAGMLDFILCIPLFLPPTVLGYGVISLLGAAGAGARGFLFSRWAAVGAAALAGMPLFYRSVRSHFESIELNMFEAAAVDGAAGLALFRSIILPLSLPGIAAGFVLAFLRALGEFGITMMVAGNIPGKTQTVSLAIWDAVMAGNEPRAASLAALLAAISLALLVLFSLFRRTAGIERGRSIFTTRETG